MEKSLPLNGAIVLWTQHGKTERDKLEGAWNQAGFGAHVPEPEPLTQVVKGALVATYGGPRVNVESLSGRRGFAVMDLQENVFGTLDGVTRFAVEVYDTVGDGRVSVSLPSEQSRVESAVAAERNMLSVPRVSAALKGIALGPLKGTSIRDGVYWIPEESLLGWSKVAKATEQASSGAAVYTVQTVKDGESLRAVVDAYRAALASQLAELTDKLSEGPGKRGFRSLQRKAEALRDEVRSIESLLGVALPDVSAQADQLDSEVAAAALAAFGSDEEVA